MPEGLENVFTLSLVLALFQVSATRCSHESGIVTVTVAGLVVGNAKTRVLRRPHGVQGAADGPAHRHAVRAAGGRRAAGRGARRWAGPALLTVLAADVRRAAAQRARRHLGLRPPAAREGVPGLAGAARHRRRGGRVAVRPRAGCTPGIDGGSRAAGAGLPGDRRHRARAGPLRRPGGAAARRAAAHQPRLS